MINKNHPFLIVLALVAVLLLSVSFIALQGTNPAEERGTLTGSTVDAADDTLLKGVTVTAVDQEGVRYTSHEYTDTTGADGYFSLELPPNDYTLAFDADGYQPFNSSASYTVKEGKTLDIKEEFRLMPVTSPETATDPVTTSAGGNTSAPDGSMTASGQSSTSPDGSQSSGAQNGTVPNNGQTAAASQTSGSSQSGETTSHSSSTVSGSRPDISGQETQTSAAGTGQVSSARASGSSDMMKVSSARPSASSTGNKGAAAQSANAFEKGKTGTAQNPGTPGSMQTSSQSTAATSTRSGKTASGQEAKSETPGKTAPITESDNLEGTSYEEEFEADIAPAAPDDTETVCEDQDIDESTDSESYASGYQDLDSQDESQDEDQKDPESDYDPVQDDIEEDDPEEDWPEEDPEADRPEEDWPEEDPEADRPEEDWPEEDPEDVDPGQNDRIDKNDSLERDEPSDQPDYPADVLIFNGHHYAIFRDARFWGEAVEKCTERGGSLAVIDDPAENEALFQYIVAQGSSEVFFGLFFTEDDHAWKYSDGRTPAFCDWGIDTTDIQDPCVTEDSRCFAMLDASMTEGHWNTASFGGQTPLPESSDSDSTFAYVCEWNK